MCTGNPRRLTERTRSVRFVRCASALTGFLGVTAATSGASALDDGAKRDVRGLEASERDDTGSRESLQASNSDWNGLSEFVRLAERRLGTDRVILRAELDYSVLTVDDALLVVHPLEELDIGALSPFLVSGGRLGIVDDFGTSGPLLTSFRIQRIPPPLEPSLKLRENVDLPLATPVLEVTAGSAVGRHPLVEGVERVATNHPMALAHAALTEVLEIRARDGDRPVAVTGVIAGKGRLLVVSDPAIFMNLMLRYPGNRAFAENTVEYLLARGDDLDAATTTGERRGGKLYVVTGSFTTKGSFGQSDDLLGRMKAAVVDAENALRDAEREGIPPFLLSLLGLGALLAVLVELLRRELASPRLHRPFYARRDFSPEFGLAARSRLLALPTTHPLLTILEFEDALRETIEACFPSARFFEHEALARDLEEAGLTGAESTRVAALAVRLRRLGSQLTTERPPRPSDEELASLHRETMALTERIVQSAGRK